MKNGSISLAETVKEGIPDKTWQLTDRQVELLKTSAHVVLTLVAVAGVIAVAAVAPNVFQILGKSRRFRSKNHRQRRKQVAKSFYYLKRSGYIEWDQVGKDLMLKLTEKGRDKVDKLNFQTLQINQPKNWDGCWWLVLADVPKDSRRQEDLLRVKLKSMGFCPFHRSVWVYPHNPCIEVEIVSNFYQIERFVTTMRVDKVEKSDKAALIDFFRNKGIL